MILCQSGFQSFHSTLAELLEAAIYNSSWSVNSDNVLTDRVVFIDLKKAFLDTVNYQVVLKSLKLTELTKNNLRWFESHTSPRNMGLMTNYQALYQSPVVFVKVAIWDHYCLLSLLMISQIALIIQYQECSQMIHVHISRAANSVGELQNVTNSKLKGLNSWLKSS